ncbi:hypothetical protein [Lacicoccus qingdaonensis]|uniref:Uncharacterized protein n=1 Tax=Lacicoccus qingdaonensis TaxID=576118 RepID=A0A1G9DQD4_9BACL|nr:hypothetical protein [Salinicoccus qingdaonensis]SDK66025.1 hypothetical protein SAMN05216216_106100 [Salinicoccus qingdaonensis]
MGFFDVIMGLVGLGGLGILSIAGIAFYAITRDYNQEKEKLQLKKIREERKLEQIKQENYLLENEDMRLELDKIKEERLLTQKKNDENKRWLIRETKYDKEKPEN